MTVKWSYSMLKIGLTIFEDSELRHLGFWVERSWVLLGEWNNWNLRACTFQSHFSKYLGVIHLFRDPSTSPWFSLCHSGASPWRVSCLFGIIGGGGWWLCRYPGGREEGRGWRATRGWHGDGGRPSSKGQCLTSVELIQMCKICNLFLSPIL